MTTTILRTTVRLRRGITFAFSFALGATAALGGCGRHAATADDCRAVLDRIIDVELAESGYRDPVLRKRWQDELKQRFAPELSRCRGLTVRQDVRRCLDRARTTEDVVHHCLD